jgi:hypothetical protein
MIDFKDSIYLALAYFMGYCLCTVFTEIIRYLRHRMHLKRIRYERIENTIENISQILNKLEKHQNQNMECLPNFDWKNLIPYVMQWISSLPDNANEQEKELCYIKKYRSEDEQKRRKKSKRKSAKVSSSEDDSDDAESVHAQSEPARSTKNSPAKIKQESNE